MNEKEKFMKYVLGTGDLIMKCDLGTETKIGSSITRYSLGVREIEPREVTEEQRQKYKEASELLNKSVKRPDTPSFKDSDPDLF